MEENGKMEKDEALYIKAYRAKGQERSCNRIKKWTIAVSYTVRLQQGFMVWFL